MRKNKRDADTNLRACKVKDSSNERGISQSGSNRVTTLRTGPTEKIEDSPHIQRAAVLATGRTGVLRSGGQSVHWSP